jgi:hypothetical protein
MLEASTPTLLELDEDAVSLSSALAEAHRAVVHAERRRAEEHLAPAPRRSAPGAWIAAAFAVWTLFGIMVTVRPAIVQGPARHPFASAVGAEDPSLRYGLWLARGRVEQFVAHRGRLPSFLGEAGVTDPAITMAVTGDRAYRLDATERGVSLSLSSRMAADSFLGNSLTGLGR